MILYIFLNKAFRFHFVEMMKVFVNFICSACLKKHQVFDHYFHFRLIHLDGFKSYSNLLIFKDEILIEDHNVAENGLNPAPLIQETQVKNKVKTI